MERKADSGLLSIAAVIASPIATAVVKALVERRRRSQSKKGADEMCRNHSHVAGRIFGLTAGDDAIEVRMLVTQDLTLEISSGERLRLPPYSVLWLRLEQPDASLDSELRQMAEQGAVELSRVGKAITSGLIIQRK